MRLSGPIFLLRRRAKTLARNQAIRLHVALDRIAADEGFNGWSHLMSCHAHALAKSQARKQKSALIGAVLVSALALPATAQDCTGGQRLFDHEFLANGPMCIPEAPERIAMGTTEIVAALLLGVNSITANSDLDQFFAQYPNAIDDFEIPEADLGYFPDVDPELVASVEPDLIVAQPSDVVERVRQLAPVVLLDWPAGPTWRDEMGFVGDLLQMSDEADQIIAEVDARIADLRSRLDENPGTFALVRAVSDRAAVQVWTTRNYSVQLLQELGFVLGENVLTPEQSEENEGGPFQSLFIYELPLERIQDLDVDHLFVMPYRDGDARDIVARWKADPLWQHLNVIQEDRAIPVYGTGRHFYLAYVPFVHLVLDDVYSHVAGIDPAEAMPNPYARWLAN